jgi:hypothetical protein
VKLLRHITAAVMLIGSCSYAHADGPWYVVAIASAARGGVTSAALTFNTLKDCTDAATKLRGTKAQVIIVDATCVGPGS